MFGSKEFEKNKNLKERKMKENKNWFKVNKTNKLFLYISSNLFKLF